MKISFLVLVALVYISAVSAKKTREEKTYKNNDGYNVIEAKTETSDVQTYQEGDAIVEEETKVIRTSVEGKRKGKRKKEKWVEAERQSCTELLAPQKLECDAGCNENQHCTFEILSEETCEWKCDCVAKIVEVVEEVVEQENEVEGGEIEKRRRKVKKEGGSKKKKHASESGKECSGKKKISFSNCLLKVKGFVFWGDDAKDADAEFAKLTGK
jgi:hypothetical protein